MRWLNSLKEKRRQKQVNAVVNKVHTIRANAKNLGRNIRHLQKQYGPKLFNNESALQRIGGLQARRNALKMHHVTGLNFQARREIEKLNTDIKLLVASVRNFRAQNPR